MEETIDATPQKLNNPAISVIIPMYNAEKYICECLDSLLAQTFQDFELILVDDCSTDSSCEIVESYMPKFGGRLKLHHMEENTGSGALPRNKGLAFSTGEYIYNMDNDDILTRTALKEMYSLAKEYDADVIYCERYYMSSGIEQEFINNVHIADSRIQAPPFVYEPTLEPEDLSIRVQEILSNRFWVAPWLKLVRHDLLDKYNITFPVLKISDDDIWTYALIFLAKKFLRVPNMTYIRRMREDSITGVQRTPKQILSFWLNPVLLGIKQLDKYIGNIEFFQKNPQQRYAILEKFSKSKVLSVLDANEQILSVDFYEMIKEEFGKELGEYDTLVSILCSYAFERNKILRDTKRKLQTTKTVDIKIFPAISVIIPMYNVEKYVGCCLESLLSQTFQNFEVIVVDDCSTDNSFEVVKSYMPKFGERLKLTKLEKNSGYAGFPRNKGIELSRGEYLAFLDPDDSIASSAFETLYSMAKKFDVDVVQCEKYYDVPDEFYHDVEYRKTLKPYSWPTEEKIFITKPTLLTNDLEKRVIEFSKRWLTWTCWTQLIRRDFIINAGICFLNVYSQDMIFTTCEICCAKNYLVVPNVFNYWRRRKDSRSQEKLDAFKSIKKFVSSLKQGINYIDEFLSRQEFFANRVDLKYILFNNHAIGILERLKDFFPYKYEFDEFLRKELAVESNSAFVAFIFNMAMHNMKITTSNNYTNHVPTNFLPYITARVDLITSKSSVNDFQLLSVSDENASIIKPTWLPKDQIGYVLTSIAGHLTLIVKKASKGQIILNLRSMDVRDPEDKAKKIPYWIDYTKLIINGKIIFGKLKPTWHDKPYRYRMEVKAEEKVKIQMEWLPHRSDTVEQNDIMNFNNTKTSYNVNQSYFDSNASITARIDVRLLPNVDEGSFQILSLSDDKAKIVPSARFKEGDLIYQIHSYSGKVQFVAKCTVDGKLKFNLRGMDIRNPQDKSKRILYWIKYTKLIINDKTVFDTLTATCHDEPYNYAMKVKANTEIKVQIEWLI